MPTHLVLGVEIVQRDLQYLAHVIFGKHATKEGLVPITIRKFETRNCGINGDTRAIANDELVRPMVLSIESSLNALPAKGVLDDRFSTPQKTTPKA